VQEISPFAAVIIKRFEKEPGMVFNLKKPSILPGSKCYEVGSGRRKESGRLQEQPQRLEAAVLFQPKSARVELVPFPVDFLMMVFRFGKGLIAAGLLVVSQIAVGQQPPSEKEKAAADVIAKIVQQTRQQRRLSKLGRIEDKQLRADACKRAQEDDARTWEGAFSGKVGSISGVAYATTDPGQPVPELVSFAVRKEHWEAHRFAVGVCFVKTSEYPAGEYWIDVNSYMSAIEAFFQRPFWY
jgi:hypothetical protein